VVRVWFWRGNLREGGHLVDIGVDRRIALKWIFKHWYGAMDWIHLTQDRERWWALVNTLMHFRVTQNLNNEEA
jgi:hypothetical protein